MATVRATGAPEQPSLLLLQLLLLRYCCSCATAAVAGSSWFVAGCVVVWDENRPLSDKAGSTDGFITSQRNLRFQNETISFSALAVIRISYGVAFD